MPDQGENAIYKAARAITRLETYRFTASHPVLGTPTLNVGTVSGGININSVPDRAAFTIDIRTVPPQKGEDIKAELQEFVGPGVELKVMADAPAVATDPQNEWVREVFNMAQTFLGEPPQARGVTYFTDASALTAAMGNPPTLIMGPGDAHMAHKTDEFCLISRIDAAAEIYLEIATRWCGGSS